MKNNYREYKVITLPLFIVLAVFALFPSCTLEPCSLVGLGYRVNVFEALQGMEVVLQSPNPEIFRTSQFFIRTSFSEKTISAEATLFPEIGIKLKLPDGEVGPMDILVEDPSCNSLVKLTDIETFERGFFNGNPNYISPILPEFIPKRLSSFQSFDLLGGWISPQDKSYGIFLGNFQRPFLSGADGEPTDGNPATIEIDTIFIESSSKFLDGTSRELGVRCPNNSNESKLNLHTNNPISGLINFDENIIQLSIDRIGNPRIGVVEEYVGYFITENDLPQDQRDRYLEGGICESDPFATRPTFLMVLTSQLTGHQLLLYKHEL